MRILEIRRIYASIKHKAGNIISGLLEIIDGLIKVLTLGNYTSTISLSWNMYRKNTHTLVDL